jgi:hypothetical protein
MTDHVMNINLARIEMKMPTLRQQVAMRMLQSFMADTKLVTALGAGMATPAQIIKRAYEMADAFIAYGEQP